MIVYHGVHRTHTAAPRCTDFRLPLACTVLPLQPFIRGVTDILSSIVLSHIFRCLQKAIAGQAIQIVPLAPCHLADHFAETDAEGSVSLVPPGLLPLCRPVFIYIRHRIVQGTVSKPCLIICQRLFIDVPSVTKDTDGHHGRDIAQIPVRPVIAYMGIVMMVQEIVVHRIKYRQKKFFHGSDIERRMPPHDLCHIRQLISIDPRCQKTVCIPCHRLQLS